MDKVLVVLVQVETMVVKVAQVAQTVAVLEEITVAAAAAEKMILRVREDVVAMVV